MSENKESVLTNQTNTYPIQVPQQVYVAQPIQQPFYVIQPQAQPSTRTYEYDSQPYAQTWGQASYLQPTLIGSAYLPQQQVLHVSPSTNTAPSKAKDSSPADDSCCMFVCLAGICAGILGLLKCTS